MKPVMTQLNRPTNVHSNSWKHQRQNKTIFYYCLLTMKRQQTGFLTRIYTTSIVRLTVLCQPGDWLSNSKMCQSQQDGIFHCGQTPEHLSLQHLSILFCLPHKKTGASIAKCSQEQHWASDRPGMGLCVYELVSHANISLLIFSLDLSVLW